MPPRSSNSSERPLGSSEPVPSSDVNECRPTGDELPLLVDWNATAARLPGGAELAQELAGLLLVEAPKRLAEMRKALADNDAVSLHRAAHTLRGSVSIFDVRLIADMSEQVESIAKTGDLNDLETNLKELEVATQRLMDELTWLRRANPNRD